MRLLALLLAFTSALCLAEPRTLDWQELIPPDATPLPLQTRPLHDFAQISQALSEDGPAATQQEPNAPVVQALDGIAIRLPGYIVPLDMDEEARVNEFLFVPFFGACIHVPPPPSNQILHVSAEMGVRVDALWQPFWIEGVLRVEHRTSELAEAGYSLVAEKIYPYELNE